MLEFVKIAGLSAVLSAGVVTAFEAPRAPVATQKFADRLSQGEVEATRRVAVETTGSVATVSARATDAAGRGDRQRVASADCGAQTWPHIAPACLTGTDGAPARRAVRTITVEERRDDARTSVLVRLPATDLARR